MIEGEISADYEMVLPISLVAQDGSIETISATIDTGFSDYLSLPLATITRSGFTFTERRDFILGDNQPVTFELYTGRILWDGQDRSILVLATEGTPLIGMRLLKGAVLFSDIRDGGKVLVRGF